MPIGVMLCFGPAIIAWLLSYRNPPPPEDDPARKHQDART
jgi:hypothetical protein